jgi:hypothetical protein
MEIVYHAVTIAWNKIIPNICKFCKIVLLDESKF